MIVGPLRAEAQPALELDCCTIPSKGQSSLPLAAVWGLERCAVKANRDRTIASSVVSR